MKEVSGTSSITEVVGSITEVVGSNTDDAVSHISAPKVQESSSAMVPQDDIQLNEQSTSAATISTVQGIDEKDLLRRIELTQRQLQQELLMIEKDKNSMGLNDDVDASDRRAMGVVSAIRKKLIDFESNNKYLVVSLQAAEAEREVLVGEIIKLKDSVEKAYDEGVESAKVEITNLKSDNEKTNIELDRMESRVEELVTERDAYKSEMVRIFEQEAAKAQLSPASKTQGVSKTMSIITGFMSNNHQLSDKVSELKEKIESDEISLNKYEAEIVLLKQENKQMQTALAVARMTVDSTNEDFMEIQQNCQQLSDRIIELEKENNTLKKLKK
jgi:chromosome segregation ATPase